MEQKSKKKSRLGLNCCQASMASSTSTAPNDCSQRDEIRYLGFFFRYPLIKVSSLLVLFFLMFQILHVISKSFIPDTPLCNERFILIMERLRSAIFYEINYMIFSACTIEKSDDDKRKEDLRRRREALKLEEFEIKREKRILKKELEEKPSLAKQVTLQLHQLAMPSKR